MTNPCPHCNRFTPSQAFAGDTTHTPGACDIAVCKGCGTPQCHGNGGARGACSVCLYGILPGWGGCNGTCSYAKCTNPAAFQYVNGKRYVCQAHANQAKIKSVGLTLANYAAKCKTENARRYERGM